MPSVARPGRRSIPILLIWLGAVIGLARPARAQDGVTPETSLEQALPGNASGAEVFQYACATCHGLDGRGAPESVVGFHLPLPNGHDLPDFTDCSTNTVEPLADWIAVAHEGGPVRALDRHMPSFGQALSNDQLEAAIRHIWTFCDDRSWPRGDLNLPRPFFTEKAFPENETVWTTGVSTAGDASVNNTLVYEHRLGSRGQYEVAIPLDILQNGQRGTSRGLGDVELAFKRALYASVDRGSIFAAGGAATLPTGREESGLGNGYTILEPFAMWGQMLGANGFVQVHMGYEIPTDQDKGRNEAFVRTAVGYALAEASGYGRAWSPMLEVLAARPRGAATEWDVVPQLQVSLSKLQHVLVNVGVRVPLNERAERKPQVLTYVLWDWFDGGLFEFWK